MSFRLAIDGDDEEKQAWSEFIQSEFPEYEQFWLKSVVPLTERPTGIHLKPDSALVAPFGVEDIAIAQLHYTLLRNLRRAYYSAIKSVPDEYGLTIALAFLVAAQDNAFELLERHRKRGVYDLWLETPGKNTGQQARREWQKSEKPPLQWIRDYRNKLLHGRVPPAVGGKLPTPRALATYADWRKVTSSVSLSDFEEPGKIGLAAWRDTTTYLRAAWRTHLL
ncbi:MAG TPA: hypothetical protein VMO47_09220 [Rhodothermales bacterium]|nr:hypothetical protein [Rhodothermales bacterium]